METPAEKLAKSLDIMRELQTGKGLETFRSRDITRTHRDRLIQNGFLKEVIKGWYILSRPDEKDWWHCMELAEWPGAVGNWVWRKKPRKGSEANKGMKFPNHPVISPISQSSNNQRNHPLDISLIIGNLWIGWIDWTFGIIFFSNYKRWKSVPG